MVQSPLFRACVWGRCCAGTETHPGKRNKRLYGEDVDVVKDILGGKTRTFEEFMPLYKK